MPIRKNDNPPGHPDSEEFIIPASDTKGHNVPQYFRCIPLMARQVEQMVQSRKFPYRTSSDLYRHAVHRHLRWLNSLDPVESVSGQVDSIITLLRDDEMNQDMIAVFNKLAERVAEYTREEADEEAARLVLQVQTHIQSMPEGYWKDTYMGRLKKKYGKIIQKARKLKLGDIE